MLTRDACRFRVAEIVSVGHLQLVPDPAASTHISPSRCYNWFLVRECEGDRMPTSVETVNLADARRIIAAAEKKAAEIGQPMNIAVADAGGNLVAHVRMD